MFLLIIFLQHGTTNPLVFESVKAADKTVPIIGFLWRKPGCNATNK